MNMKQATLCLLLVSLCCLTSCYHFGTPGNLNFALGELNVENKTKEAKLKTYMIAAVREQIDADSSASLSTDNKNQIFNISIAFKEMRNLHIARAKMRDTESRDDDSDAYQSVLFRIRLTADVMVTSQDGKTIILKRTYTGHGDLPNMHDRELPLQQACKQAVNSIANQLVNDLATSK